MKDNKGEQAYNPTKIKITLIKWQETSLKMSMVKREEGACWSVGWGVGIIKMGLNKVIIEGQCFLINNTI